MVYDGVVRTCAGPRCHERLSPLARADARFCSGRCRVRAHRARQLPAELTKRPRWVRRSANKVPLTVAGSPASSSNPATWASYAEAEASSAGVGLGFVLNGDGIGCIDLDHCLTDGELTDWARKILDRCPATFVEVSPSGHGLHVWGRIPEDAGRRSDGVEVYSTGRYIATTGQRFEDAPLRLADLSAVADWLVAAM